MEATQIITELQAATASKDYLDIWRNHKLFLESNDAEIIFTQDDFENPSLPSINMFENDANRFKSLFQNNNFVFLNAKIFNQMDEHSKSMFHIDYTVSFDTQFASFIQKYFTGKRFPQEQEFEEILYKLIDNDVNSDYIPYVFENLAKGVSVEGVKENVKEIVRFFHLDKSTSYLLKNMKISDPEKYESNYHDIISNTIDLVDHTTFEHFKHQQEVMYLLLMKIVLVNKEKKSPKQKLTEFVDFMHHFLYTIFDREMTVAECFYDNPNECKFFNGVRNINEKTLQRLQNMAWDFALVRLLESTFSIRPNTRSDFFLSYFLTFDEGLSQVIDTYPLKAIFILNSTQTLQVISNIDKTELVEKYKLHDYFSYDAYIYRMKNRDSNKANFINLIKELENEIKAYV